MTARLYQTMPTIKQHLFWTFFYNVILIPAAVLGFLGLILRQGRWRLAQFLW